MLSARKVELFGSFIRRGYHPPLFFQQDFSFSAPGKNTSGEFHQASALLNRSIIFLSYACPPGTEIQKTYTVINYLYMIAEECPIVSNADTVNIF